MREFGKPKTIGSALTEAVKELGIEKKLLEQQVALHWQEIVGEAVAKNATLLGIEEGKLRIHVPNAVWRQELQLARASLRKKINDFVGAEVVKEIILR